MQSFKPVKNQVTELKGENFSAQPTLVIIVQGILLSLALCGGLRVIISRKEDVPFHRELGAIFMDNLDLPPTWPHIFRRVGGNSETILS